MSLPAGDTVVTYPDGDLASTGTVLHLQPLDDGRTAVILDRTAFHPVDPVWPDQPADAGVLLVGGRSVPVVAAVVGATDGTALHVGDAPVRTGTPGWAFVVCHLVDDATGIEQGATAAVEADPELRRALSAGHTACHLASLALDDALAALWTKEVPLDGRGRPAFDQLAIASSRILPYGSVDEYRIGKSLRKKGFAAAELPAALGEVTEAANVLLAQWVAAGDDVAISIERDGGGLGERRRWRADLPGGAVEIPCGGTHLRSLAGLSAIRIQLDYDTGESSLTMRTTVEHV
ncbi:metal-dependent hydrolase [Leifsonia shinshuensis]|uniref:metal-dependent hydrolase n=1 Tax=Leifsonia shinshuensis TaxID=150026 RepID=UPI001F5112BC|nr:metal-dependent hydrolase [Leifsonia shinshuensis]MCI0155178.1 metal-dependent hydrolase [Leifsonia shinshuensis]